MLSTMHHRCKYAERWLEKIATEEEKLILQESIPKSTQNFTTEQNLFCADIAYFLEGLTSIEWTNEKIKTIIFDVLTHFDKKQSFEAIYLLFFDKKSGPQVSWMLASLDKQFVINRLRKIG